MHMHRRRNCRKSPIARTARAALIALIASGSAAAQGDDPTSRRLEQSPRHHEWADVSTASGRTVRTWVVFPEVDRPVPAVVIIHENRGLNDWARSVADQIAEAGYVALAPDLLSGMGPGGGGTSSFKSTDDASTGISALTTEQVMSDLDAVVAHARSMAATTDVVAVGGFCWGGGQTFRYAVRNPDIAAAYVFYGSSVTDESQLAKIKAPVYGFYGGNDFRITGSVEGVAASMKKLGKTFEPVVYEGAGHAFMRSGETADADHPNRKAYLAAWKRWKLLLGGLEVPPPPDPDPDPDLDPDPDPAEPGDRP